MAMQLQRSAKNRPRIVRVTVENKVALFLLDSTQHRVYTWPLEGGYSICIPLCRCVNSCVFAFCGSVAENEYTSLYWIFAMVMQVRSRLSKFYLVSRRFSIWPSHACFVTKRINLFSIFCYHIKHITVIFLHQQSLMGDIPSSLKFRIKVTTPLTNFFNPTSI